MIKIPNINQVIACGRLTADPELKYTPTGMAVCNFRMAVSKSYKDKETGEWKDDPSFFNVVVWSSLGELAAERLHKGSPVFVEGELKSKSWEQDGHKRYALDVNAKRIQFLEKIEEDNERS